MTFEKYQTTFTFKYGKQVIVGMKIVLLFTFIELIVTQFSIFQFIQTKLSKVFT